MSELFKTSIVEIIQGDLLESKVDLIVHQCNCVTTRAVGIAESINKKYPYADIYSKRTEPSLPGHCELRISTNSSDPKIACLLGQYKPGKAKKTDWDSQMFREIWFATALGDMLEKIKDMDIKTIGFPKNIGCGYAGGKWENYYEMIENFAKNNKYQVKLYKID